MIIQQIIIDLPRALFEDQEFRIIIHKTGNPLISKLGNSISCIPRIESLVSNKKSYKLDSDEFEVLKHPSRIDLGVLKKKLEENLEGCMVSKVMIKGQLEGLQIEWDDLEVEIVGFKPEDTVLNKRIPVAYGILQVIALKPDWLIKGGAGSKMEDRLLMGFSKYNKAIYEGKLASYVVKGDGIKYVDTQENMWGFRKRDDVTPIDHKGRWWRKRLMEALIEG